MESEVGRIEAYALMRRLKGQDCLATIFSTNELILPKETLVRNFHCVTILYLAPCTFNNLF
jgi:hypothetical protein